MTPRKTLAFLQQHEWSMGNGQCPFCLGMSKNWLGHPCCMDTDQIGHAPDCGMGLAIRELGGSTIFLGEISPKIEMEYFVDPNGVERTRPKTAEGCPIWKERARKRRQQFRETIVALWDDTDKNPPI